MIRLVLACFLSICFLTTSSVAGQEERLPQSLLDSVKYYDKLDSTLKQPKKHIIFQTKKQINMSDFFEIPQSEFITKFQPGQPLSGWLIKYNHTIHEIQFYSSQNNSLIYKITNSGPSPRASEFESFFENIHDNKQEYVDFFFLNYSECNYVFNEMDNLHTWHVYSGINSFILNNKTLQFKTLLFKPVSFVEDTGLASDTLNLSDSHPNLIVAAPCPPCWHVQANYNIGPL